MNAARSPQPASVTRRTRRTGLFRPFDALPAELVTDFMEYLPAYELWAPARVSRQFYACALRAGLLIHRYINWVRSPTYDRQLAVFKEVLEHARRKDLRLSLQLSSVFPGEYNPIRRAEVYAEAQAGADELFSVLSAALPFLVSLSISIPDHFRPQLDAALRFPAPKLRHFYFSRPRGEVPCPTPLPCDLFGGTPAQLRTLTLGTVPLPEIPVPAFQAVCHAVLSYWNPYPPVEIARHFPHLTSVRLELLVIGNGDPILPNSFDFSLLDLHGIVISDCSDNALLLGVVERSVDLSTIPIVQVAGPPIRWNDKIWSTEAIDVSIRITFCEDDEDELRISVLPAHQHWRRLYAVCGWDTDMSLPIGGLPNISTRLTYLRIDAPVVRGFLALELQFPALRDLHVDIQEELWEQEILAPPDYELAPDLRSFDGATPGMPRVWAPCPALDEITLFALDEPIDGADSRRVAFLAHALGQLQRHKADRAALALVGFEFAKPVARILLAQTVSKIRRYAFAGRDSPEDYDEGLWQCELFDRE